MAILNINNLYKYFGHVRAVDGVSFNINEGEFFGLLGPNGAGKTTTVKMILGLLEPDQGTIEVFNMDPFLHELEVKHAVGYVSEEPLVYESLTVQELFNFIASIRGFSSEKEQRFVNLLQSLNALQYYDKAIATLSRGNKQKIQLIASLLHEPKLLILDEPLAGLDAKSVRVFKEILNMHIENGGSILFSTHIMAVAQEICDRIAIINEGKIVAIGTVEELSEKANKIGASLEDIFLKLTEQDESVHQIITQLRASL